MGSRFRRRKSSVLAQNHDPALQILQSSSRRAEKAWSLAVQGPWFICAPRSEAHRAGRLMGSLSFAEAAYEALCWRPVKSCGFSGYGASLRFPRYSLWVARLAGNGNRRSSAHTGLFFRLRDWNCRNAGVDERGRLSKMPQMVSYEDLARVMDVQPKSIADLVSKGMPHEARGQYDVGRCLAWYVRYLHGQMNRRGITEDERNSGVNLRVERYRLLKIQADLGELELFERRRAVIPIAVYEKLLVGWAITIRQRVLALPGRLSTLLVSLDRRAIHDVMDRECRDMLTILSTERPANDSIVDGPRESHRPTSKIGTAVTTGSPALKESV